MPSKVSLWVSVWLLVGLAAWVVFSLGPTRSEEATASREPLRIPTGGPQLISIETLPMMDGQMCQWIPASASTGLIAVLQQPPAAARSSEEAKLAEVAARKPLRIIRDPYAAFSSVAVDPVRNEVVLTDENLFNIVVYDRLENTPPTATMSEPKRMIGGLKTKIEFQCSLYIDPPSGDIYAVNNDTVDTLVIFSRQAKGDVPPDGDLETPHGTFGIAVDETAKEMFLTVQHSHAVVVYPKSARGKDAPIRLLQGNRTQLADPHGIAVDSQNGLIFVTNHGSTRRFQSDGEPPQERNPGKTNWPSRAAIPGSGTVLPSSITVYPKTAQGNSPPVQVITGPKTQLNWPAGVAVDPERGELYVANDMGSSVLVFSTTASGAAAPIRVLQGPKTLLENPTGIFLDLKNNELWVANFGNHTTAVYKPTAEGNTPPLRIIRSAPTGKPSLMIGNPGSLAYDTKREEILVPN